MTISCSGKIKLRKTKYRSIRCTHDLYDRALCTSFCEGKAHGSLGYDQLQGDLHRVPCNPRYFPRFSTAAAKSLQTFSANDLRWLDKISVFMLCFISNLAAIPTLDVKIWETKIARVHTHTHMHTQRNGYVPCVVPNCLAWAHLPTPPLNLRKGTHSLWSMTFFRYFCALRRVMFLIARAVSWVFCNARGKRQLYMCDLWTYNFEITFEVRFLYSKH